MSRIIAIHQPNFFPWLGLFHKISLVDTFYFFDHVQVTTGKGWHSRVKINLSGKPTWLTIPIYKSGKSGQSYAEIKMQPRGQFLRKHLGTIRQAYSKAPHFDSIFNLLEELYDYSTENLCEFNMHAIKQISCRLGLSSSFQKTSNLLVTNPNIGSLSGNKLVLEIAINSKAETYVSGTGCLDFIKPSSFNSHGIDFVFQDFAGTEYQQLASDEFLPGLSVIDALMNLGWEGVSSLLGKGNQDKS
ncbi:MAG: hypothetical protein CMI31_12350 [Opitutae bacterium]|nr:hypothetical protein [Opitutae bacterium]